MIKLVFQRCRSILRPLRPWHLAWLLPLFACCAFVALSFIRSRSQENLTHSIESIGGEFVVVGEVDSGVFAELTQTLRTISNGMINLSGVQHTYIWLRYSGFDDSWLKHHAQQLKMQPRLELGLWKCGITDEGLIQIGPIPQLVGLSLHSPKISGRTLGAPVCQSLEQLEIPGKREFTAAIPENCVLPALKNIRVGYSDDFPNLEWLTRQPKLEYVEFGGQSLSADAISQLNRCNNLKVITVVGADEETISALTQLVISVELRIQAEKEAEKYLSTLESLKVKNILVVHLRPSTGEMEER